MESSKHSLVGFAPNVEVYIDDEDVSKHLISFEWKSFVNGGYIISIKLYDPWFTNINKTIQDHVFPKARNKPLVIKFRMLQAPDLATDWRIAYLTDIRVYGNMTKADVFISAIDPPTWLLNAGSADGRVYKGKISNVIKQVVADFAPSIKLDITDTNDSDTNKWWMMRMDPKTFISSLLGWSAPLTDGKTNWLVSSVDDRLIIKQQHEMAKDAINLGEYTISSNAGSGNSNTVEMISNPFISVLQSKLVTSGISAVSGQYIDKIINPEFAIVDDDNTGNKVNTKISRNLGLSKPVNDWSTHIKSIPELSGGELGIPYHNYIDGNARNIYMRMLPLVTRIKLTTTGDYRLHDSSKLGVSKAILTMYDFDNQPYFLHGPWLVYGFTHRFNKNWSTDLYMYRIDYNANALRTK